MNIQEQTPLFTNALITSPSPYLRQHAHNPVMWYPWSPEALDLARTQDKPILLSVGYSSCYWCHVMEREVFENPSIAAFMNEHFINIKVDREEHPEIDEIYMIARQLMTREGGWPNNVFLTPDLKPFYAGGTYGAKDMHERPAFPRLLEWLNHAWIEKREETEKSANATYELMQRYLSAKPQIVGNTKNIVDDLIPKLIDDLIAKHDDVAGGFYKQPKFLHETYLDFLISAGHVLDHKQALDTAAHSMLAMAAGGVYDQVACGFHRYSVDRQWYVPHFEKMLYNQAMCASIYTHLFTLTNNPFFADIARGTLEFVAGPMTSEEGGFYTAIDAETDGVEGAYYAWNVTELQAILDENEIAFFTHYFALADIPHFPGHKKVNGQVIIARKSLWEAAKQDDLPFMQVAVMAGQLLNKLLSVRNQREAPLLDDKIITSWNGLMIAAYAEASYILGLEKFKTIAEDAAQFITKNMLKDDGTLLRIFSNNQAYIEGQLEDYSYLAHGLLELHRVFPEQGWLQKSEQLLEKAEALFFDSATNQYTLNRASDLQSLTISHSTDSVLPSPVAMILSGMVDLYEITKSKVWLKKANALAAALSNTINPATLPEFATLLKVMLKLKTLQDDTVPAKIREYFTPDITAKQTESVKLHAEFTDNAPPKPGAEVEIIVKFTVVDGWYISPHHVAAYGSKLDIFGDNIASLLSIEYPTAKNVNIKDKKVFGYTGEQKILAKVKLKSFKKRKPISITLHYQPCREGQCLTPSTAMFEL